MAPFLESVGIRPRTAQEMMQFAEKVGDPKYADFRAFAEDANFSSRPEG